MDETIRPLDVGGEGIVAADSAGIRYCRTVEERSRADEELVDTEDEVTEGLVVAQECADAGSQCSVSTGTATAMGGSSSVILYFEGEIGLT